jgi:hypothetical protein
MSSVLWLLFWIGIWPLGAWAIDRMVHPRTPERRIARLLGWYPASWRKRHGDGLEELLRDAVADGRDGPRMTLDVARAGIAESLAAVRWDHVRAAALVGTGWTMFFPQGIVAAILTQFDVPPSWFLALHAEGEVRFLVAGAMAGIGLLLVDRGHRVLAAGCGARKAAAAR